jgi:hypothetical protein
MLSLSLIVLSGLAGGIARNVRANPISDKIHAVASAFARIDTVLTQADSTAELGVIRYAA